MAITLPETPQTTPQVQFNLETVVAVWDEIYPLFKLHWAELTTYPDIELNPDKDFYLKSDALGLVRVFTARGPQNALLGYSVYFVFPNHHYRQVLWAQQDVLFILKSWRGIFGKRFIAWCDEVLKATGVQMVSHHIKAAHDFSPVLKRLGYNLQDLIYTRRLF